MNPSTQSFFRLAASHGRTLPDDYGRFLDESAPLRARCPVSERAWILLGPDDGAHGLRRSASLDRYEGELWRLAEGFAALLEDLGIEALEGPETLAARDLRQGVVVGESDGDYLLILPSGEVWCFYHDGHEAKRLAPSWSAWLASAEVLSGALPDPLTSEEAALVGTWSPVSSETEDPEIFALTKSVLRLDRGRNARESFPDGSTSEGRWSLSQGRLHIATLDGTFEYEAVMSGDELSLRSVLSGSQCSYARIVPS